VRPPHASPVGSWAGEVGSHPDVWGEQQPTGAVPPFDSESDGFRPRQAGAARSGQVTGHRAAYCLAQQRLGAAGENLEDHPSFPVSVLNCGHQAALIEDLGPHSVNRVAIGEAGIMLVQRVVQRCKGPGRLGRLQGTRRRGCGYFSRGRCLPERMLIRNAAVSDSTAACSRSLPLRR
jgi:hypothetical protein